MVAAVDGIEKFRIKLWREFSTAVVLVSFGTPAPVLWRGVDGPSRYGLTIG
jgi:hypothetical protein